MKIKISSNGEWLSTKDTIALAFFEDDLKIQLASKSQPYNDFLNESFKSLNFTAEKDQSLVLRLPSNVNAIIIGAGKKELFSLDSYRDFIAVSIKIANKIKANELAVSSNFSGLFNPADIARAAAETSVMAQYKFDRHKSERLDSTVQTLVIGGVEIGSKVGVEKAAFEGQLMGELNIKARDLANTPPGIATPAYISDQAKMIAKERGLSFKVITKKEMESMGMNGILSVGQGSRNEPRLAILEYKVNSKRTIALVGKGVCFDSGGLDIKGAAHMETMKMDKSGAIAVMVAMEAVAKIKPKFNVVALMPLVENLVSDTSYKPGDIIKTMSGKTIEVLNTDAEGRVILSDALHYAVVKYQPEALIDLATLTGAVVTALGNNVAGIMGNDETLISRLIIAGTKTHERLWELPMFDDYHELIKSDFADIKNVVSNNPGSPAGTITGAAFLSNFVGDAKWAHLDIAGTAWSSEEKSYFSKGATGFGVRLLVQFIMDYE